MFWSKKSPRILIVEDDTNNHPLYRSAFEKAGFDVLICQNAEDDFTGEVAHFKPDIISMDLMIAKEGREIEHDGFAAIEVLKADERTKEIPVIVLTNFGEAKKVEQALKLGVVDFINLQGQSLASIVGDFKKYVDDPKHYRPSHQSFRK